MYVAIVAMDLTATPRGELFIDLSQATLFTWFPLYASRLHNYRLKAQRGDLLTKTCGVLMDENSNQLFWLKA